MKLSNPRHFFRVIALSSAALILSACEPSDIPLTSEIQAPETTTAATAVSESTVATTMMPPSQMILTNVPFQTQKGILPTGCELVSALMLLRYHGLDVSIDDVVSHTHSMYPTQIGPNYYAPHPSEAFIGSPDDKTSFGCFPPVVVDMMNQILPDNLEAVDSTGTELQTLAETYLPQELPVLVWATINMDESYEAIGWYLLENEETPTDEWYFWKAKEHCLVLIGYDEKNYYFNDPSQEGSPTPYPRNLVETRYAEIGKMSAVVTPKT